MTEISEILEAFPTITLEEMSSIRLMNRTDTKFVTTLPVLKNLLALCQEDYFAQVIEGIKIAPYRTVYWDTDERHEMFQKHQSGQRPRTKVRARTYESSHVSFLEVKKKDNHGKTKKKRIEVQSIDNVIRNAEGEEFLNERTDFTFLEGNGRRQIFPSLGNHFDRITLVNRGHTERLTIDFNLRFDNFENGREKKLERTVIIELKRDGRQHSPILPLLRQLRVKPSGFSKYCIGSALTNPEGLRINNFKEKLILLKKYF